MAGSAGPLIIASASDRVDVICHYDDRHTPDIESLYTDPDVGEES